MKRTFFFIVLFVISNSLFVFIYGIIQEVKASHYVNSVRDRLLAESAVALALHTYEDTGRPDSTGGNTNLYGKDITYLMRSLTDGRMYIKITCNSCGSSFEKEYIYKK